MKLRMLAIVALFGFTAANNAFAQDAPSHTRAKLQVVLNYFEGGTKTGSLPFLFSLEFKRQGSLRFEEDREKVVSALLGTCPSAVLPATAPSVSTQVDSTVVPEAGERFSVTLVWRERALAGCRMFNGASIPVFSNKTLENVVSLKNGESREIQLQTDSQRNESIRLSVALTIQD